jgi:hypothetical protein
MERTGGTMPDGMKRARRNGERGAARKAWYAHSRSVRFSRRFGFGG